MKCNKYKYVDHDEDQYKHCNFIHHEFSESQDQLTIEMYFHVKLVKAQNETYTE